MYKYSKSGTVVREELGWVGGLEFSRESLGIQDHAQLSFLLLLFSFAKININACLALIIISAAT